MHSYFCGWYFRCQSDQQTLAVIPSVHKPKPSKYCTLQLITDTQAFHVPFPFSAFQKKDGQITLGGNRFGKGGICLGIHTPDLHVTGSVRFGAFTPIQYDIMGPFRYVPFLQCRHSIFSMRHSVDGTLWVNGTPYVFRDAVGYMEGDRGYSFPTSYVWTQCSFSNGALMLSVADIPLGCFHFTGGDRRGASSRKRIPPCHLSGRQSGQAQAGGNCGSAGQPSSHRQAARQRRASSARSHWRRHDPDNPRTRLLRGFLPF